MHAVFAAMLALERRDATGLRVVQVSDDVLFKAETYDEIVERVRAYIQNKGSITVAEMRDLFKTSRKYALGMLEHLDAVGVTKRVGDERLLR